MTINITVPSTDEIVVCDAASSGFRHDIDDITMTVHTITPITTVECIIDLRDGKVVDTDNQPNVTQE